MPDSVKTLEDKYNMLTVPKQQIRAALEKKIGSGMSQRQLANETGVSTAMLSQMFSGKLEPQEPTWQKLLQWYYKLDQSYTLIRTENLNRIHKICHAAMADKLLGMIVGDTGLGKTTALETFHRHYSASSEHHVYYVKCKDWASRDLVAAIEKELQISTPGNLPKRIEAIRKFLIRKPNSLLIIDEASLLKDAAIIAVRLIYGDFTDAASGIIMAGVPYLEENIIKQSTRDKKGFKEVLNRIHKPVLHLQPATEAEIKEICRVNGISAGILLNKAIEHLKSYRNYTSVRVAIKNQTAIKNMAKSPEIPV